MNINKAIQKAIQYYQSGDFEKTDHLLKQILKKHPNNVIVLNFLGATYLKSKNCDLSIQYFQKALHIAPNNADIYFNLGNALKEQGQFDNAIFHYQKAIKLNPNCFEAYHNLGTVSQTKKQLDNAIVYYQKALQFNPTLVDAYYNLGTILQDKGQLDDAIVYYQKALQFNPTLVDALNNLGSIYTEKGKLDDAKTCYKKLIQLDPENDSSYYALSYVNQLEGQRFATEKTFIRKWTPDTMIFQVDNEKRLLFLEIPRAGSSTVKQELFWKPIFGNLVPEEIIRRMHIILNYKYTKTLDGYKSYFKFTIVRDPYARFISAYFLGIHKQYRWKYDLLKNLDIEDWPDEILNNPNKFIQEIDKNILNRDPHTALQTYLLPKDLRQLDFIGQLENMEGVEKKLSQVLQDDIKFVWMYKNLKKDDHSVKIEVDRFNQIFAEDYETLKDFYSPLKI